MWSHSSPRAICGIKRCASEAATVQCAPACLAGEDNVVETVERAGTRPIDKRSMSKQGNVIFRIISLEFDELGVEIDVLNLKSNTLA